MSQEQIISLLVLNNFHQEEVRRYQAENSDLKRQVAWFKRQLWGRKSEKRILGSNSKQLSLGEDFSEEDAPPPPKETVKEYQRKRRKAPLEDSPDDTGLRFDSSVPVQEIEVPNPELKGLSADDYELIEEKYYYSFLREYNHGHLRWLRDHDWDHRLAAFTAIERLDNLDYLGLRDVAVSIGAVGKALTFFNVHIHVKHYEAAEKFFIILWKSKSDVVKSVFQFIGSYQLEIWRKISDAVFKGSY